MPKFAISQQVEDVADDHDQDAHVAAVPVVGGSTTRAADTEDYASTIENITAAVAGKTPSAATKRSRSARVPNRTKAARTNGKKEASGPPLTVFTPLPIVEAVSATPERGSGALALVAAVALATIAAYFSVTGMAEIFPGAPVAIMLLAATMEAGKLVMAGWLAAHWRQVGWKMRSVMIALVTGLALINAAGVFGKLVETHVSAAASARAGVAERIDALDARVAAQSAMAINGTRLAWSTVIKPM